jgi:diaminohydroxyphosphoribosylaminopyrimidine deaminase/5-amino-6-(5-phosphoribosylamino)uracil reductase
MDFSNGMRLALAEARRALGPCHSNPAVGAIVEHGGEVVARGFTQPPGGAHAEVMALRAFRETGLTPDESTTLFVTLEPCSTHGRTPPCTDAIQASGIRRVVVGATDPNPAHGGRGFELLREHGIEVITDVLAAECAELNLVFHHWIARVQPLLAAKIATTLDGKVATRSGHSQWITGPEARQDVARWRRAFPAIGVGGGTVVADDPSLTARVDGEPLWCPRRLIFDRRGLALSKPDAQVFSDAFAERTIYLTSKAHLDAVPNSWRDRGVEIWEAPRPEMLREELLAAGITGLYLEGGARLLSDLLAARQLDYLFAYRAPKWLGDELAPGPFAGLPSSTMDAAYYLVNPVTEHFGVDQMVRGWIQYPSQS